MVADKDIKIVGHSDKPNLWYINWYAFFMAFPCMDFIGISVTFFFFLILIYNHGNMVVSSLFRPYHMRFFFYMFLLGAFISTFMGPPLPRPPPIGDDVRFMIQHVYWILMSGFFIIYAKSLNLFEISKYVFFGVVAAFSFFYFLPEIEFKSPLFSINTRPNRNGVIYSCLALIPFSFYYIHKKLGTRNSIYFLILFNLAIIFTEGRSGTIVFFIESILISQILFPVAKTGFKVLLIVFGIFTYLSSSPVMAPILNSVADGIEGANPRIANLIRGEKEGDLEQDRSWLFRLIMVEKAQEIIVEHPIFGLGVNHFKAWDGSLRLSYFNRRMIGMSKAEMNKGSAHNSYYQLLSENGLWGTLCVVALAFVPVFWFLTRMFFDRPLYYSDLAIASITGISIHWYTISSFMGGVTWLAIALATVATKHRF
ncbi:MAG: O-antigen ligase family protein [Flavobacteriales bacterium]|nr:O-antigen ligase family protein [Flavobacteriales bacterium]